MTLSNETDGVVLRELRGWRTQAGLHQISRDVARAERDHWRRLFNRLDAAITHHKRDAEKYDVPEIHDEALWAARDRVLRDSADPLSGAQS